MEGMLDDLPKALGCLGILIFIAGLIAAKIADAILSHLRVGWH